MNENIQSLSALDGRYCDKIKELTPIFSEFGLHKRRVYVECQWLVFLSKGLNLFEAADADYKNILSIADKFDGESAAAIKAIEATTNHDVKAVEYYIKEQLDALGLSSIKEWVHFACTSEDINNLAYCLMIQEGRGVVVKELEALLIKLEQLAHDNKNIAMMSRTHGQPASPTTVGKEFINFAARINDELILLNGIAVEGKINGATGNFNAHLAAYTDIDWPAQTQTFLKEYLGLKQLKYTTQINSYSYIARILHSLVRLSSIIIDLDRDMWNYISINYFKQKLKSGEVGSSTMPHKVNPIDFENAEGNLGLAIALMNHMAVKLLNSRMQRDLTDSTVLRNLGAVFGYVLLGVKSTLKGLNKVDISKDVIAKELEVNWELLAEPVQTVMRVYGEENPYEKLKELTRGSKITASELAVFIDSLKCVPEDVKETMKQLTPDAYTGAAVKLVDQYFKEKA